MTVDPAKLTDINLLKRHVLKRCVYGVDLNPMAVELAKVSLWLDCFTLGAPLNFLDHHLRCGNSLVGAMLKDLEEATASRLFALDLGPVLRAINHVLFVSRMADATAAEVTSSANEFDLAHEELSGLRIVFDLLVAKHFGLPRAASLVTDGQDLDVKSKERLMASLDDDKERTLVDKAEDLARRPDRRFFNWDIEFPEVFFGFIDNNHRQVQHKNKVQEGSAGFDCVVGNPPYDVLAEKELEADLEEILGYFKSHPVYEPAQGGKQNLYKLFICRGVHLLRRGGRFGHIVPMPLLGDEQAAGVRKLLLTKGSLSAIEAFPQKDDPHNRVFEDAKLATCIFIEAKKPEDTGFKSRVHPGGTIEETSPSLNLRCDQVKLYDPENQPILACSQEDWDLAVKVMSTGRMRRMGEYCTAYQGEVNETTDGRKGNVSYDSKDGQEIVRGASICLYVLRPASQGEPIYLRVRKYLSGKKPGTKAWHHQQRRVGLQESCPQNNFRRIIAAIIPKGEFCNHVINYFPEGECKFPLEMLLALLNSKLSDWYFRLGSTNAHVNHYQIYNLPAPCISSSKKQTFDGKKFVVALDGQKWNDAFKLVEPLLADAPFPPDVIPCMVNLVERITRIEEARGNIARAERSALDGKAQPLQDLIDRMIYRMAGLTDSEIKGLEERLKDML